MGFTKEEEGLRLLMGQVTREGLGRIRLLNGKSQVNSAKEGGAYFALIMLICFLGYQDYNRGNQIEQQKHQIADVTKKLAEMPQNGTLEQQANCAKRADFVFKDGGWKPEDMATNINHYNPQMNRCFVEIDNRDVHTAKGELIVGKNLFDAFEGRQYGGYAWISQKDKKYWEVKPMECWVLSKGGEKQECSSDDEFDKLAKQYLQ